MGKESPPSLAAFINTSYSSWNLTLPPKDLILLKVTEFLTGAFVLYFHLPFSQIVLFEPITTLDQC